MYSWSVLLWYIFDIEPLYFSINSVTQTAMKNALKRITKILNSIAGHMLHVSQNKVDEILSNSIGDIRNALLNLIFISLKGKYNKL